MAALAAAGDPVRVQGFGSKRRAGETRQLVGHGGIAEPRGDALKRAAAATTLGVLDSSEAAW
jgi:hypothetical protein